MTLYRSIAFAALLCGPASAATVTSAQLVEAARPVAVAAAQARWAATAVEVQAVSAPQAADLPAGAWRLSAGAARVVADARIAVPVVVDSESGASAARTVWFAASGAQRALVATRSHRAGAVPDADAFEARTVRRTLDADRPVPDAAALVGQRLRTPVAVDEVLVASALEPMPAVDVHQRVKVRATSGSVLLETRGTAQGAGAIGEQVEVAIAGTTQRIRGRVTAPAEVTIDD